MTLRQLAYASGSTIVCIMLLCVAADNAAGQARGDAFQGRTRPDLQGAWALTTVTPLERPSELADKPFFTEQEALDWERNYFKRRQNENTTEARISPEITDTWNDAGKVVPSRRTSLIIDPSDGRIPMRLDAPPVTPETFDDPEGRPFAERCILWTEGPPMVPSGVTGHLQIVQTSAHVVIVNEMIHHARIIPLDRPHLPPSIQQLMGDSRGHWEGDTLIVDTTNFTGRTRFRRSSAALRVIEQFRRLDEDTIYYTFTVTDPTAYTKPWTAEMVMTRMEAPIFEYACHEANYTLTNVLRAARAAERATDETNPR